MRPATLLRSAFALALVLAGFGWTPAQAQSLTAGAVLDTPFVPTTRGGDDVVITQSLSDVIEIGGVSCGNQMGGYTTDNGYFRAFDLEDFDEDTDDITVTSVDMGIGSVTLNGNAPVTTSIRFYSVSSLNPDGSFQIGDATLIGEQDYVVSEAESNSLQNIPINDTVVLEQDEIFAFEWFVPTGDPASTGNPTPFDIRYGSNNDGQTGPTLLAAEACGIIDPVTTGSIGFPDLHWVLFINGTVGPGGDGPELVLNPTSIMATVVTEQTTGVALDVSNTGNADLTFSFSGFGGGGDLATTVTPDAGTVPANSSQSVAVVLSAEGLVPGTYTDEITLTTNDEDEGMVTIPITLEVIPVPAIEFNPNPLVEVLETGETGTETVTLTNNTDDPIAVAFPQYVDGGRAAAPTGRTYPHLELGKGERDPRTGDTPLRGSGGPDEFGYQWIDSNEPGGPTYSFVDISATGNPLNLTDDDGTFVPLPFTFSFYDEDYTQVGISSNGYLTFDQSDPTPSDFSNDPIPDPAPPNSIIAPFWDDLDPGDGVGQIYWQDLEDGRFVVQYQDVPAFPGPGQGSEYTFQAILNASGAILFQYQSMEDIVNEATVGIENEDGSIGLQIAFNAPYVEDGLAVLIQARPAFVTDVNPAAGIIPAGASVPVEVTFDASGLNGGSYTGTLNLEAVDGDGMILSFDLPVVLVVTGESDCVIDPNPIDFGDLIVGESSTIEIAVNNTGTDTCTLTDASFDDAAFSTDFEGDVEVNPGGQAIFSITFTPDEVGPVTATLTVELDGEDDITATVQGSGLAPASFSVDPDALMFAVEPGDVSDAQTLTLSNDGDGVGSFSVSAIVLTNRPGSTPRVATEGPVERQSEIVTDGEVLPQTEGPTRGGDIVQDPSFEEGTPNPFWDEFSSNFGTPLCDEASCGFGGGSGAFDGTFWTWFGGIGGAEETGSMEQDVTIPSGTAVLSFWHEIPAVGTTGFMSVQMDGEELFRTTDADGDKYATYLQVEIDISDFADGGTHTLRFESTTDAGAGATNFFVDLVEISSEAGLLISVDPETGDVAAGESEEISVVADATNAEPGLYSAEVIITTNDPDNETITVPVTVQVGSIATEDEGVPTAFELRQNYPNPFAAETTIKYALPEAARVTITVYDAGGRRVATLVDADRTAGYHEAQWATGSMASGVYFYRIEAGTYSRTMKMSLVR